MQNTEHTDTQDPIQLPIRTGLRERKPVDYRKLNDPGYSRRHQEANAEKIPDLHAGYLEILNMARNIVCGFEASDPYVPDKIEHAKESSE
ncbi:hypothetical protein K3495_g15738 [Podosphaera aphanis]|nr:hypothetical protein K3495_g15738 [Podosphaera aphanis]